MAAEHTALIGQRIAEAREAAHMTQAELAAAIPGKADGTQVSKWERGIHRPSDDTLEHIARVLKQGNVAWFLVRPADKSQETPNPFADDEPSQLARIERKLDQILSEIERLRAATEPIDVPAEIHRAFEDYASRLGREVGKRPPRSRVATDPPRARPANAA